MATNAITLDAETMGLDELRKLAEEEARKQSTTPTVTPSGDEEVTPGANADPDPDPDPDEEEEREFVAQRSFDLGDGSGSQVYKGHGATREEALEDLSNKLIEAQKNATKRIKELKGTKTPQQTREDESLLAAEIVTNPSKVVKSILGIDPSELKEVVAEVKENRAAKKKVSIADQFVVKHPEFLDNTRNGQRLAKAATLFGEFSLENLEKAYQDLSESGLLEVKGEEAGRGQEENKSATRTETLTEVTPSRVTRKASGVSTHSRTAVTTSNEPSEDDLYSMPLDKLRQLSNKQLAGK